MVEVLTIAHALSRPQFRPLRSCDLMAIYASLQEAGVPLLYPDFRSWFFGKVAPGLETSERFIVVADIKGALAGVAICKRSVNERKLCTLWVQREMRERGVAGALARRAFNWLETDQPLFTVPEEKTPEFGQLVRSWNFSAPVIYQDLYRTEKAEYVYNGPIRVGVH